MLVVQVALLRRGLHRLESHVEGDVAAGVGGQVVQKVSGEARSAVCQGSSMAQQQQEPNPIRIEYIGGGVDTPCRTLYHPHPVNTPPQWLNTHRILFMLGYTRPASSSSGEIRLQRAGVQ